MQIFEVYELWRYEWNYSNFFENADKSFLDKRSSWSEWLRSIIQSIQYEYILNILAIVPFLELSFRDRFYSTSNNALMGWFLA